MNRPITSIVWETDALLARIDSIATKVQRSRSSIVNLLCLDALDRQSSDTIKVGIIHEQRDGLRA
jgi:hypothetical protein